MGAANIKNQSRDLKEFSFDIDLNATFKFRSNFFLQSRRKNNFSWVSSRASSRAQGA